VSNTQLNKTMAMDLSFLTLTVIWQIDVWRTLVNIIILCQIP